jgi:hypothetical protein
MANNNNAVATVIYRIGSWRKTLQSVVVAARFAKR